jgi:hypothetical protein
MSLLSTLNTEGDIAEDGDRLGGSGPLDTNVYPFKVGMAYTGQSTGGAMSLTVHLASDADRDLRQTIYLTSGKAKGQKPYYETKDGDRKWLPGFTLGNHLALMTTGKEIKDLATEEKVVALWNREAGAEVPTKVQVVTAMIGQEILAAVWRQTVDKNVKNDAGDYVPSGETRDENEIEKFFHAGTRMTVAEAKSGAVEKGAFIDQWIEKYAGQVKDKSTKVAATGASPAFAGAAAAANSPTGKPTESLFGS